MACRAAVFFHAPMLLKNCKRKMMLSSLIWLQHWYEWKLHGLVSDDVVKGAHADSWAKRLMKVCCKHTCSSSRGKWCLGVFVAIKIGTPLTCTICSRVEVILLRRYGMLEMGRGSRICCAQCFRVLISTAFCIIDVQCLALSEGKQQALHVKINVVWRFAIGGQV